MTQPTKTTLGFEFILRTLKTTGVLLLLCLVFVSPYAGFYTALAIMSAGVWSMINLFFLVALVKAAVKPGQIDKIQVAVFAFVKFPLLYLAGYFLLKVEVFGLLPLLIGFSLPLAVVVLKVVARVLLGMDNTRANNQLNEAL